MNTYLILLRGVNVGGKNKLSMAGVKAFLEDLGYARVSTYIASGNVIAQTGLSAAKVKAQLEAGIPKRFRLDDELVKVLVLDRNQLRDVAKGKPGNFGEQPGKYHSDVIFLIGIDASQAMPAFAPRDGVDKIWPGRGVIYSQRLSALRTKSRLSRVMSSPEYKSMTIRNWNTTTALLKLLDDRAARPPAKPKGKASA